MKSVGRTLFELSRYNEVWTDRRTDGQTDKVITIGLPHLRWRGPNNKDATLIEVMFEFKCMLEYPSQRLVMSNEYCSDSLSLSDYSLPDEVLPAYFCDDDEFFDGDDLDLLNASADVEEMVAINSSSRIELHSHSEQNEDMDDNDEDLLLAVENFENSVSKSWHSYVLTFTSLWV